MACLSPEMASNFLFLGIDLPFVYKASEVKSAYRAKSKVCHPDRGGSEEDFRRVQAAYEDVLAECFSDGIYLEFIPPAVASTPPKPLPFWRRWLRV